MFPDYAAPWLSEVAQERIELEEHAQLCANALPAVLQELNLSQIIAKVDRTALAPIKRFKNLNANPLHFMKNSQVRY